MTTNEAGYVLIYDPIENALYYVNPITRQRVGLHVIPFKVRTRLALFNAWLKLFYPFYRAWRKLVR
jgi:hypothetical protein